MPYATSLDATRYVFDDLKTLLAQATPARSGDSWPASRPRTTRSASPRRWRWPTCRCRHFLDEPLIPYETDEVTRLIVDTHDAAAFAPVAAPDRRRSFATGCCYETDDATRSPRSRPGLTPEMAAAVCKLMRNQDLILVASKCRVVTRFRNTLGLPGRLSVRLQPNHPTDDPRASPPSILDGLLYGCGDAVIGINPATDSARHGHARCSTCSTS